MLTRNLFSTHAFDQQWAIAEAPASVSLLELDDQLDPPGLDEIFSACHEQKGHTLIKHVAYTAVKCCLQCNSLAETAAQLPERDVIRQTML